MQKTGEAAPTGCFKCGRPGHWSRDCPSSSNPNPNSLSKPADESAKTTKRVPTARPKLTPELLLSDDGIGYLLRHFPRSFKYHGKGHEVRDLGNILSLYAQWHSHLIPYYSYDQFVRKVEQLGTTRRVRMCLRDLRQRIANGGDPTKLHESHTEHEEAPFNENVDAELAPPEMDEQTERYEVDDAPAETHDLDDIQEEMFDEIYRNAAEEAPKNMEEEQPRPSESATTTAANPENPVVQPPTQGVNTISIPHITDEQRARMEANRLKALERAAARKLASQLSETLPDSNAEAEG